MLSFLIRIYHCGIRGINTDPSERVIFRFLATSTESVPVNFPFFLTLILLQLFLGDERGKDLTQRKKNQPNPQQQNHKQKSGKDKVIHTAPLKTIIRRIKNQRKTFTQIALLEPCGLNRAAGIKCLKYRLFPGTAPFRASFRNQNTRDGSFCLASALGRHNPVFEMTPRR